MSEKEELNKFSKELQKMKSLREKELEAQKMGREDLVIDARNEIKNLSNYGMHAEYDSFSPLKQAWYRITGKAHKDEHGWKVERNNPFAVTVNYKTVLEPKMFIDGKWMTMGDVEKKVAYLEKVIQKKEFDETVYENKAKYNLFGDFEKNITNEIDEKKIKEEVARLKAYDNYLARKKAYRDLNPLKQALYKINKKAVKEKGVWVLDESSELSEEHGRSIR